MHSCDLIHILLPVCQQSITKNHKEGKHVRNDAWIPAAPIAVAGAGVFLGGARAFMGGGRAGGHDGLGRGVEVVCGY